jgi:hypothetical protein
MKTRTRQSAFAMLGEACLVGGAAETFLRLRKSESGNAESDKPEKSQEPPPAGVHTLQSMVIPALPEQIRRLINAACTARGGAERMSLNDWREAEEEIKRKIKDHPVGKTTL